MQNWDQGRSVREFLVQEGISQNTLAERANVSQSTVSRAMKSGTARHSAARIRLFSFIHEYADSAEETALGVQRVARAFERIWDGSEAHAAAVARIIDASRGLRPAQPETGTDDVG